MVCLKHVVVCLLRAKFWNVGCWNDCQTTLWTAWSLRTRSVGWPPGERSGSARPATPGAHRLRRSRCRPSRTSSRPGVVGRLSYVFLVGSLLFSTLFQNFAGISPEFTEFHRSSLEVHQIVARTSNWSTSKKGDNHNSTFPHPGGSEDGVHSHFSILAILYPPLK